mmetsp:Transcript_11109/g.27879  ORF Transcript_11109/g.27879 Transcript_11109/m.27879 type:complete len:311 (+) Transcript_11109:146-1078(+)
MLACSFSKGMSSKGGKPPPRTKLDRKKERVQDGHGIGAILGCTLPLGVPVGRPLALAARSSEISKGDVRAFSSHGSSRGRSSSVRGKGCLNVRRHMVIIARPSAIRWTTIHVQGSNAAQECRVRHAAKNWVVVLVSRPPRFGRPPSIRISRGCPARNHRRWCHCRCHAPQSPMLRRRRHVPRWRDADPRQGDHGAGAASGGGGEAAGRRELPRHSQRHGSPGAQEAHLRHGPCDGRSRPHGRDPEAIRRNWSRQPARHEPWPNRERWPRRPTDGQCHGGGRVQAGHPAVWRWRPLDKRMCRQRRRRGKGT